MYDWYHLVSFFIIYAFFGWCLEVVYQAVEHGKFINRGFLNGPYCPIYGLGVIIVTGALEPIKQNVLILFIGSVILTSALELITGFLLEKIFHMHWWDYSGEHFNIGGYICLKFSLLWGIACLIVVRLIHPAIQHFTDAVPHNFGLIFILLFSVGFMSDMIVTVMAIVHINKRLVLLDNISAQMRKISDKTGEKLFDAVESAKVYKSETEELTAAQRAKLEELRRKYKEILENKGAVMKRLEKAFPKLKLDIPPSFKEQLRSIKNDINNKLNK
ncbi:MAG: hypothetical protein E7495_11555 [Ruminococcus flavefaciens]|nr:hypothetical protein [Ruminococcus flavefaciens]